MHTVADHSALESLEKAKLENSLLNKVVDNVRTIYYSHKLGLPMVSIWSPRVLRGLGEAQISEYHRGVFQLEL